MNLVRIEAYACGYYSDAEWSEEIYLTEESYNKIKEQVDELEIYVCELDGKHSETKADIAVTIVKEEDFSKYSWKAQYAGYNITETLAQELDKLGIDIDEEKPKADKIIEQIDGAVTFSVTVKESQRKLVENFIKTLK